MRARLSILALAVAGCQTPPPAPEVDGSAILEYVEKQVAFGPRVPGTEAHRLTYQWLAEELGRRADTVVVQGWRHRTAAGDSIPLWNVIGRFQPGAQRRLLLLAHWDSRPVADYDTGSRAKQPVPGANDGGSGVAVLLAVADALKARAPGVGVDVLFVDGEDYGTFTPETDVLLGSRYYAANQLPGPRPEYAILLDIVGGRNAQFRKEGHSLTAAPAVVELVWNLALRMGYGNLFLNEAGGTITDDHVPLQAAGIRAINIIGDFGPSSTYPWWHTTEDTPDKLSPEVLAAVGNVVVGVVREAKALK
ncbi:MAG: M28 family peptidase [Gemmatimonadetes bacterium]|nr:M28 family peptidase [Gemmatimonadota bacterium]